MSLEDSRIEATNCPGCGTELTGAARPNANDTTRPVPGDYSVCIKCRTPCRFDQNMQLVALTEADIAIAPLLDFTMMNNLLKEVGEEGIMQGIAENYDD